MSGWRCMLRMARRDALRARGRSLLVLLMIALPVMTVSAADIVIQTQDVSGTESLTRRLGAADAEVRFQGITHIEQLPDPDHGGSMLDGDGNTTPPTLATVSRVLGRPVRGLERRQGGVRVSTDKGVADTEGTEIDLRDPLSRGLFRLTSGRLPAKRGEVVVNAALAARGPGLGEQVTVADGVPATVVGIVESSSYRSFPVVVGPLGGLGLTTQDNVATWLVDAGPVTWQDVRALNRVGAMVLSRTVVEHPPPPSQVPAQLGPSSGSGSRLAVVALIVVMALLEVVLLAGPAFAVGARRQQRNLAVIAASGGTPRQLRRVVLASAFVLGATAAGGGVLAGIGVAFVLMPVAQRFSAAWFGPFEISWPHLVGIAAFGLLSAFLAAVVPAVIAARQDVVKVLAGRRGDRRASVRSPLLGVLLLGAGVAGAVYGTSVDVSGELYIAASAVVTVLGMILLVPVAIVALARTSHRLPLPVRYAMRDATRHRTRTVPAVAAVAATVAGVVALGIGASSDALQNRRTYQPNLPLGLSAVSSWDAGHMDWARAETAVRKELPGNQVTAVRGIPDVLDGGRSHLDLAFEVPGGRREHLLGSWSGATGSSVLVARGPGLVPFGIPDRGAARQVLARGGAVVLTDHRVDADTVRISADFSNDDGSPGRTVRPVTVPAVYVEAPGAVAPFQAVVSPRVPRRLGVDYATTALLVAGPVSKAAEADVAEAVGAVSPNASFYVERGYQADDSTRIALLVLAALGGVLMLGGTLTATFLALSDARPDLATLSAVGAAPRTRRGVAAAYAGTVGLVGAVLGALVGFVPGIAVTYPLTRVTWTDVDATGSALPDHFVDVPWLLVATVVLLLPLVTAAVVGVTARSRLPLVARVD